MFSSLNSKLSSVVAQKVLLIENYLSIFTYVIGEYLQKIRFFVIRSSGRPSILEIDPLSIDEICYDIFKPIIFDKTILICCERFSLDYLERILIVFGHNPVFQNIYSKIRLKACLNIRS